MKCKFMLVFLVTCAAVKAENGSYYCCAFDTSVAFAQWTMSNNSTDSWRWSGYLKPVIEDMPNFHADSDYIWMENFYNDSSTKTAILKTYNSDIEVEYDDVISVRIYRHISNDDGSYRPVLKFVSNYGAHSQDILWTFSQDSWSKENVTCGQDTQQCCPAYPCIGYFEIVGTTMEYGEFLAIDYVSINLDSICDQ